MLEWSWERASQSGGALNGSDFAIVPNEVQVLLLSHLSKKERKALQRVCYLWGYLIESGFHERFERSQILKPTKKATPKKLKALMFNPFKSIGTMMGVRESPTPCECIGVKERKLDNNGFILNERIVLPVDNQQLHAKCLVIRHFDLPFKKSFIKYLKENRSVTHIEMMLPFEEPRIMKSIFSALRFNQSLTELSLVGSSLTNSFRDLINILKSNPRLTNLDLSRCSLIDMHAVFLARALQDNQALTTLKLKGNSFQVSGPLSLAQSLKTSAVAKLHLGNILISEYEKNGLLTTIASLFEGPGALTHFHFICHVRKGTKPSSSVDSSYFSEALKKNSTLQLLHLEGSFLGRDEVAALTETLAIHPTLSHLNLASCTMSFEQSFSFCRAVGMRTALQVLKISRIASLFLRAVVPCFHGCWFKYRQDASLDDSMQLSLAMETKINMSSTLTYLDLHNINFGEGLGLIAKALQGNETIRHVNLSRSYSSMLIQSPSQEVMQAFMRLLESNNTLISLSLKYINLSDSGHFNMIADGLKVNQRLAYLDMSACNINDKDAEALADALKVNIALTDLNLRINYIGARGCKLIAKSLMDNTTLTKLDLMLNPINSGIKHLFNFSKFNSVLNRLYFLDVS